MMALRPDCERCGRDLPPESRDLLALTVYVAHQSRDLPIAPPYDPRLDPFRHEGAEIYRRRQGQPARRLMDLWKLPILPLAGGALKPLRAGWMSVLRQDKG